jgi:predicted methyltransferase
VIFSLKNGNCRITEKSDVRLFRWSNRQRKKYKESKLLADQISRLESLGFEFDLHAANWEDNFKQLELYKAKHGDCRVPYAYKPNKILGAWVNTQRQKYRKGKLSPEIIARLENIGFEWRLKENY